MVSAKNAALIGHSQEGSWVAKKSGDLWAVMTTRMSEWKIQHETSDGSNYDAFIGHSQEGS